MMPPRMAAACFASNWRTNSYNHKGVMREGDIASKRDRIHSHAFVNGRCRRARRGREYSSRASIYVRDGAVRLQPEMTRGGGPGERKCKEI
jgi:hypothetical protein